MIEMEAVQATGVQWWNEERRVTGGDRGKAAGEAGPPSLSPSRGHLPVVTPPDPGLSPLHPTQHQLWPYLQWPQKHPLCPRVWWGIKNGPSPQPGIVRVNSGTCLCGYLYTCPPTGVVMSKTQNTHARAHTQAGGKGTSVRLIFP